jgi:hypothetical protein
LQNADKESPGAADFCTVMQLLAMFLQRFNSVALMFRIKERHGKVVVVLSWLPIRLSR